MTRRSRSLVLSVFTLAVPAVVAYYLIVNADKYITLLRMSWQSAGLLGLAVLASMMIGGAITTVMFRGLGVPMVHSEGFMLSATASLANQLPISGGIVARAVYLKRRYGFPYTTFASAMLALFICFVAANGVIGLAVLLCWRFSAHVDFPVVLLIGFGLMAGTALLLRLPLRHLHLPGKADVLVGQALEGWNLISQNPSLIARLIALQVALLLSAAVGYWIAFHMLSQNVTIGQVVLFSAASILTQLATFAPGGLGVTEAIVGAVAASLGYDLSISVAAVALNRLITTALLVCVGGISAAIMGHQLAVQPATIAPHEPPV